MAGSDPGASSQKTPPSPTQQANAHDEAYRYWGYLFQPNKCPAEKLDRLLRSIAACIAREIEPNENNNDLTPTQLCHFYRSVGGDYGTLFLDKPHHSIAFIYRSLGCLHSLQPSTSPDEIDSSAAPNPYSAPSVPALKPRGFVTWQSIQLLLDPDEHVSYLQEALRRYNLVDPFTGEPFLKELPDECLPAAPDQDMLKWHEGVGQRLRYEAAEASRQATPAATPQADDKEKSDNYFDRQHSSTHRHRDDRPAIVRSFSKAAPAVKQGGKAVALTVRNIASPYLWSNGGGGSGSDSRQSRDTREGRRHRSTSGSGSPGAARAANSSSGSRRRRSDGHPHAHFADDMPSSDDEPRRPPRRSRPVPTPSTRARHAPPRGSVNGHPSSVPASRRSSPPSMQHRRSSPLRPESFRKSSDESFGRPDVRSPSPELDRRYRPGRRRSHEPDPSPRDDEDARYYERHHRPPRGSHTDSHARQRREAYYTERDHQPMPPPRASRHADGPPPDPRYMQPPPPSARMRRHSEGRERSPPSPEDEHYGRSRPVSGEYLQRRRGTSDLLGPRNAANSGRPRERDRPSSMYMYPPPGPIVQDGGNPGTGRPAGTSGLRREFIQLAPDPPLPPPAQAQAQAAPPMAFRDPFDRRASSGSVSARDASQQQPPPVPDDSSPSAVPPPPPPPPPPAAGPSPLSPKSSGTLPAGLAPAPQERLPPPGMAGGARVDGVSGRRYVKESPWR